MIIEKDWVEEKTSQYCNLRKSTGVGLKATNLGIVIARHGPCGGQELWLYSSSASQELWLYS